ncbi:FecR family protein [Glycocaulis sp.]|uniref:FecR family protein n=1 Tax=Glycocaulis sp. TaxID=1969725 RepID=UPI003D25F995
MNRKPETNAIDEEATRWAVRADAGPLSPEEEAALNAWLEADVRHVGAYARAQALWLDADRLAALARGGQAPAENGQVTILASVTRRRTAIIAAASAMAATLLAVAGVTVFLQQPAAGPAAHVEMAEIGEIRRIVLDDGSMMTLNTGSTVQIAFSEQSRSVHLDDGEAAFEVSSDPSRPFLVHTAGTTVRVVGTHFVVRRHGDGVLVTVAEGEVAIERGADSLQANALMAVQIGSGSVPSVRHLDEAALSRQLSWQTGRLLFDGETLAEAITEMNRYSPVRIELAATGLASERFVGAFRAGDTRTFAETVATAYELRVVENNGVLRLTRR